jgi:hypothetical protein
MYIYLLCACLSVSIYHFSRMLYCQSTNIPQLKPPTPALYVCLHLFHFLASHYSLAHVHIAVFVFSSARKSDENSFLCVFCA